MASTETLGRVSWRRQTGLLLRLVKFEHTLFALPFALAGAFLAAEGWPRLWALGWIVAAAVGARNFAFALNRLADKEFDARNPRTRDRLAYRGILEGPGIWVFLGFSLALFLLAASLLNRLTLALAPAVVAVIIFYSYSKRWTWVSHGVLGFALACAPAGAWIAIRGDLTVLPLWLSLGVVAWVAGFDVIYACLDFDFDRAEGLHSIPARFGITSGLRISGALHALTVLSFGMVGWIGQLGLAYWVVWGLGILVLAYQHAIVKPHDLSRANFSFFHLNAYFSALLAGGLVLDSLLPG